MRSGLTLYCIRHGETDWNRDRRYQGQRDIPLNDTGREQATHNGRTLAQLDLDISSIDFVSSPLGRARETMERVRKELGLPEKGYQIADNLKELHYGDWEGSLLADLKKSSPESIAARQADPFRWRATNGESYDDLLNRLKPFLNALKRDSVVVTHGGVTRVLRVHALDLDPNSVLSLEVPQDRVLKICKGEMSWL